MKFMTGQDQGPTHLHRTCIIRDFIIYSLLDSDFHHFAAVVQNV